MPQKWDLADELIDDMRQYQITGLLCVAEGVSDSVRIEKTLKSYMEHRENYLEEEFKANRFNFLGEYILEKESLKYRLHYEKNLVKEELQNKSVISNTDELFIERDAVKLVRDNIKSLNLSVDVNSEIILQSIEHDLAQIHQNIPKATLTEVAKLAILHTEQLIAKHNNLSNQQNYKVDTPYSNNKDENKQLNLSKADVPVLALALASDIITHNNANKQLVNDNYMDTTHSNIMNNIEEHYVHIDRSINNLKNSFKFRLEQESIHFEHHQQQQQVMQMQRSGQHSMEI